MGDSYTSGAIGFLSTGFGGSLLLLLLLALIVLLEGEDDARIDTVGRLPAGLGAGPVVKVGQVARARPAQFPIVGQIVFCGRLVHFKDVKDKRKIMGTEDMFDENWL